MSAVLWHSTVWKEAPRDRKLQAVVFHASRGSRHIDSALGSSNAVQSSRDPKLATFPFRSASVMGQLGSLPGQEHHGRDCDGSY